MSTDPPVSGKRPKEPRVPGEHSRGLPSVHQARAERRRTHWLPPRMWLWAVVCIGAGIVVWWKLEQGEVNEMRAELLARQRAVKAELGGRWFPLRDKIETWTQACGVEAFIEEPPPPELVKTWDFRDKPGIYLRLAQEATKTPEAIREAATKSLHDGFTACLVTVPNPNPLSGPPCLTAEECESGQICNEFSHCARPSQPFNLRTAFNTMQVLSDDWVAGIQEISNKLTMRGALATFNAASDYDLPIAADFVQRSQYFLVVVDEPPLEGTVVDEALELAEEDAAATDDRSIATAPHPARVCLYRLEDEARLFAVRLDAAGELRGGTVLEPKTRVAQQRQANSCSLALSLREAIGATGGAAVPDDEGSAPGEDREPEGAGSPTGEAPSDPAPTKTEG